MKKESENYFYQEKLSILEVESIAKKINDPRLNHIDDSEYFFIETDEGTNFIPKNKFIGSIEIDVYLKDKLKNLEM